MEILTSEIAKIAGEIHKPKSYAEAIRHPVNRRQWQLAINEELNSLLAMGTFKLRELPPSRHLVTLKWVFRVKYTSSGLVNRFKARLVARGFTQIEGIDYDETFAPTLHYESLRLLLFLAVENNWQIQQMDVDNAYLAGHLNEEIYMELPQGYTLPKGYKGRSPALKLLKGLYGLKQSGRIWNKKFKAALADMSFRPISADNCVFANFDTAVIISLYVDDLLLFTKRMSAIEDVKQQLKKHFKMKDLGEPDTILGIQIKRGKGWISINQPVYIKTFLTEYGLENCKAVTTPIDGYEALTPSNNSDPRTNQREYQKRIGHLMHAMRCTQPDIAFAVSKLSQWCQDPAVRHRTAVDRVMKYLKGTADVAIVYKRGGLIGYSDSAFGDDRCD